MLKIGLASNFECFEDLELIQQSEQVIIVRIHVVPPFLDKCLARNYFQIFFTHKFNVTQIITARSLAKSPDLMYPKNAHQSAETNANFSNFT